MSSNEQTIKLHNRRMQIVSQVGNIYILSSILSYLYPTKDRVNMRQLLNFKQIVPDFKNSTDLVMKHLTTITNELKGIFDVCSKCYLINSIYFCKGKYLCPICKAPMLNHSKFKFNALKYFDILIYNQRLIHFKMRHEYTSGLVDIHLLPGLTGYVNVTFNDGIYNCLYTRGLLDGTQLIFKGDVDQKFEYSNGKMHGEVTEIFNLDYYNTKHYVNGILEGTHTIMVQGILIYDALYINGLLDGTVVEYNRYTNQTTYTDYKNGQKHGLCVVKRGETVISQDIYQLNVKQHDPNNYKAEHDKYGTLIKETIYTNGQKTEFHIIEYTLNIITYSYFRNSQIVKKHIQYTNKQQPDQYLVYTNEKDYSRQSVYKNEISQSIEVKEQFINNILIQRDTVNKTTNLNCRQLFHKNGQIKVETPYYYTKKWNWATQTFGQKIHGYVQQWDEQFNLISKVYYSNGKKYIMKETKGYIVIN